VSYFLAPSLIALRDEINARYPKRDKSSDGWIGDTSHAARPSDHNPDWAEGGIVRAIDIDIDGGSPADPLVQTVLKATIGDPRVYYVIYNSKIYSRTYGYAAHRYTGSNPHDKHIHVSIRDDNASERDKSRWLDPAKPPAKPLPIDLPALREQMQKAAGVRKGKVEFSYDVRRLQKALNAKYGKHLTVDGLAGTATLSSYARHEKAIGGTGRIRIPDMKSLPALIKGRYYIKEQSK
jgi:hypothetical protein